MDLGRLGLPGKTLEISIEKVFQRWGQSLKIILDCLSSYFRGIENHTEQACAVRFLVYYANDHPKYHHYILGPRAGTHSVVARLNTLLSLDRPSRLEYPPSDQEAIKWLCRALCAASRRKWAVPTLLDHGICNVLLLLLVCVTTPPLMVPFKVWLHLTFQLSLSSRSSVPMVWPVRHRDTP